MRIYAGWHNEAVGIPGSGSTARIMTLPIPVAGFYSITAKAVLSLPAAGSVEYFVDSKLTASSPPSQDDWDDSTTTVRLAGDSCVQTTFLQVVHHFRSPGEVRLECVLRPQSNVPGEARNIKIIATEGSALSNQRL